jgi:hypothetical protein
MTAQHQGIRDKRRPPTSCASTRRRQPSVASGPREQARRSRVLVLPSTPVSPVSSNGRGSRRSSPRPKEAPSPAAFGAASRHLAPRDQCRRFDPKSGEPSRINDPIKSCHRPALIQIGRARAELLLVPGFVVRPPAAKCFDRQRSGGQIAGEGLARVTVCASSAPVES